MEDPQLVDLLASAARSPIFSSGSGKDVYSEVARIRALLRSHHPEIESALRTVPEIVTLEGLRMGVHGRNQIGRAVDEVESGYCAVAITAVLAFACDGEPRWRIR